MTESVENTAKKLKELAAGWDDHSNVVGKVKASELRELANHVLGIEEKPAETPPELTDEQKQQQQQQ